MFRLSQFMHEIVSPGPIGRRSEPPGPVVIWNLIRRCNLLCKHCYSISGDVDFPGELSTEDAYAVVDDLEAFHVPVLILSGGEPLLRRDILNVSRRAKQMGFYVGLSINGTLIKVHNIEAIADIGYDYVDVSLDGLRETHDQFRRRDGAFEESLAGVRLCRDHGIKVGLCFTATSDNAHELPALLDLAEDEGVEKFYLSHLNYAGRGNKNRGDDARRDMPRDFMDTLFERAYDDAANGGSREFVTGNNNANGVYFLMWVEKHHPELADHIREKLVQWGGNASSVNVANIDNLGNVHPDTFWWHYSLGNVTERAFSDIWTDTADPIMAGLKARPCEVHGRCGQCQHFDICGGNTRVRSLQLTGDPWAEDPACYLTDAEIGLEKSIPRLEVTPFTSNRHAAGAH